MAKKKASARRYEVLVPCHNNKTGKAYEPGDVIKRSDFPAAVVDHWVKKSPPVLREVD